MNIFKHKLSKIMIGALLPLCASAQSEQTSMVSAVSVEPASIAAEATLEAVPAGAHWVLKDVRDSGTGASVVLEASGDGAVVSIGVGLEAVGRLAQAVGKTVEVVATSTGHVVYLGSEAIAYVPNELGRGMLHHRELSR